MSKKSEKELNLTLTISKNLRSLRLAKGYSQKNLADLIAVEEKYISALETKPRHISTRTLEKLAAGLGVSPKDLLETGILSDVPKLSKGQVSAIDEVISLLRVMRASAQSKILLVVLGLTFKLREVFIIGFL